MRLRLVDLWNSRSAANPHFFISAHANVRREARPAYRQFRHITAPAERLDSMLNVKLPDGSVRSFEQPVSVGDIAAAIGPGLAKAALAGRVNGRLVDTTHVVDSDAEVSIVTDRDADGLAIIRHSSAHLLAHAVKELFPDAQVTIGPVVEDGFYYDFSYKRPFTPEDLAAIEKRMAREVLAITGCALNVPSVEVEPVRESVGTTLPVTLDAPEACPRYCGRLIKGVDASVPTPRWIVTRLERSGLRSISAIVDITNYVMWLSDFRQYLLLRERKRR